MVDLFQAKNVKPMLIGVESDPFDSENHIFELKLDGVRCIAYLDSSGTELRNKKNIWISSLYPELSQLHVQANKRCILDGELIIMNQGKPDFDAIMRRAVMSNKMKIDLAAAKLPASFAAFDILYYDDRQITALPLIERKAILQEAVKENDSIAISRYVEKEGKAFYKLTEEQDLEGIVAKRIDSYYYFGKLSKDWIKIKNLKDADYVVCGYIRKKHGMTSLILGQYRGNTLVYKGHVSLGVSGSNYRYVTLLPPLSAPPLSVPAGNENAIWVEPVLVCKVSYMYEKSPGSFRQRVFKGLRNDKTPLECIE